MDKIRLTLGPLLIGLDWMLFHYKLKHAWKAFLKAKVYAGFQTIKRPAHFVHDCSKINQIADTTPFCICDR